MKILLALSRIIDAITQTMGRFVAWAVVAAVIVSATNAVVRKLFDVSSNSWLELQWWLFGLVFLFAAPWTLKAGEHIRIDILHSQFTKRTKDYIEIFGTALFLLPVAAIIVYTAWPFAWTSFLENEQSYNAGGLPQWPPKMMIPLAFMVLFIQGISELIKRVAHVRGLIDDTQIAQTHSQGEAVSPRAKAAAPKK